MTTFTRDNKPSFADRGSRGGGMMYKARCGKCGKECEVPFQPTGNRPVFCRDCFREMGSGRSEREDSRRTSGEERQMYDAVCDTCGKNCKIPFQPRSGKPVFCSNCFEKKTTMDTRKSGSEPREDSSHKEFEALNAKLDTILKLLTTPSIEKEHEKPSFLKAKKEKKEKKASTVKKS